MLRGCAADSETRLERHRELVGRIARLESLTVSQDTPAGSAQAVLDEATLVLPLGGVIDLDAETARLRRDLARVESEIAGYDRNLADGAFLAKAPDEVVEAKRERRTTAVGTRRRIEEALAHLAPG